MSCDNIVVWPIKQAMNVAFDSIVSNCEVRFVSISTHPIFLGEKYFDEKAVAVAINSNSFQSWCMNLSLKLYKYCIILHTVIGFMRENNMNSC